jgi:putative transposase
VYRAFFKAHLDPETIQQIRSATNGNFALGKAKFAKEIEWTLGRRARPGKAGRPARRDRQDKEQLDLL